MQKEPLSIQLSYMEMTRLSNYEMPLRKCWVIFNRQTSELAKVVSTHSTTACLWLKWDIKVCDISEPMPIRKTFGIIWRKQLTRRKDVSREDR